MSTPKESRRIAKLGNENYYAWAYRMEMRLRKMQVWSLVDGTESRPMGSDGSKVVKGWRIRMDLALSEIVCEVEDGQLVHTRISRDPAVVWARLESIHLSQGLGSAISTWQKLFQIKKLSTTSIQEHAGKIRELADRLTHLDDTPSDSLLVAVLMLSLPPSYSSLVISLDSHANKNDFDFVVQRCMNEEARQAATEAVKKVEHENRNEAFLTDEKPRRDRKDITCFKCQKKGHYRNECTSPDEKTQAKAEGTASAQTATVEEEKKQDAQILAAIW